MKVLWFLVLFFGVSFCIRNTNGQVTSDNLFVVSGTVKFGKAPVQNALIQFTDEKNHILSTKSDTKGKYRIELPAGTYKVFASGGPTSCQWPGCTPEFY